MSGKAKQLGGRGEMHLCGPDSVEQGEEAILDQISGLQPCGLLAWTGQKSK